MLDDLIRTNLTEPDVELFMNLTHYISLVRLMKSSMFGVGLSYKVLKYSLMRMFTIVIIVS